jgi:hypothetical protein
MTVEIVSCYRNNLMYFLALLTISCLCFAYMLQFQCQWNWSNGSASYAEIPRCPRQLYVFQQSLNMTELGSIHFLTIFNSVSVTSTNYRQNNFIYVDLYSSINPVSLNNMSRIVLPLTYFFFIYLHFSVSSNFLCITSKIQISLTLLHQSTTVLA